MKNLFLLACIALILCSCGNSKTTAYRPKKTSRTERVTSSSTSKKADKIVAHAKKYKGTRYKFGGTSSSGMDCSGLIYVAYAKEEIALPRVSRDMAKKGKKISISKVTKGDLVFFQTNKSRNVINHVGLVIENKKGVVSFIHATSSKGVLISSMDERYWKNSFKEARRII